MGSRRRRVIWSEGASRELDEAIEYIAQDSLDRAIRVLDRLLKSAASLADLPDRGRVAPEQEDPTVRELLVDPYRLIYSAREPDVVILGVLHQRRDFDNWEGSG